MALQLYRIPQFRGINQSACENSIDAGESPDARNMDTAGGRLSVARGYARHHDAVHPAPADVLRMGVWHAGGVRRFLTATAEGWQALAETGAAWETLAAFDAPAVQADFQTVKIGSDEYLLLPAARSRSSSGTALRRRRNRSAARRSFRMCRQGCWNCITAACLPRATRRTRAGCTGAARRATRARWRTGRKTPLPPT